MTRVIALGLLLTIGTLTLAATSRPPIQEPRSVTIQSMDVRENLYVISGGGGHTAALVTEANGVVLVDTKLAGWGQSILEAVQAITSEPVTVIINTHTHGDHVGGNANFPATVEIVAHENASTRMASMDAFAGSGARFLPDQTFGETLTLFEGRDRIDLYYFGAGHTDGDTVVVFPALGTAHMGDLFAFKGPPYIDVGNGGSGVAYPDTLDRILASIEGVRSVIPGHIPPPPGSPMRGWTTWNDLRQYARFNRDFLEAARASRAAGHSVDEAVAALDLWTRYPDYGMDRAAANMQAIYDELGR
jgi:glyoxylase-like metal-dependent hydrolase (beta-lactamase superfamily II)